MRVEKKVEEEKNNLNLIFYSTLVGMVLLDENMDKQLGILKLVIPSLTGSIWY